MAGQPQPNERLLIDGEEFLWSDAKLGSMVSCRWSLWRSVGKVGAHRVAVAQPADHGNADLMAIAADVQFELMLDPVNHEVTKGLRVTIDKWTVFEGEGKTVRLTVAKALVSRIVDEAWSWARNNAFPSSATDEEE